MKIRKSALHLLLLFCTTLLPGACNRDMELSPEVVELEGPITYGSMTLVIEHRVPLGIGKILIEAEIPLRFPVKQGGKHVDSGEFAEDWEVEGLWDLRAAGDVVGASTTLYVPTTYEVRGVFHNCEFKFDIVENIQYSQVRFAEVLAWGEIAADMGEDKSYTYFDEVLKGDKQETTIEGPSVPGKVYLGISNISLPADTKLICGFSAPDG